MKATIMKKFALLILIGFAMGCSKEDDQVSPVPNPNNPSEPNEPGAIAVNFRLQMNFESSLTGAATLATHAIISIDSLGTGIWTDKEIGLEVIEGDVLSEELQLFEGTYSLTRLILFNQENHAVYAVPLENSSMADSLEISLPVQFELKADLENLIDQPVVFVEENVRPALFGYHGADFGEGRLLTVKLTLGIHIGEFLYDNLGAMVDIKAYDEEGGIWEKAIRLGQGINSVDLPAGYSSYTFAWYKWDLSGESSYARNIMDENMVISLNGSRPARMIRSEETYMWIEGVYNPYSKSEYFYNDEGRLIRKDYYQKQPQHEDLRLQFVSYYTYNSIGKPVRIEMKNADESYLAEYDFTWFGNRISSIQTTGSGGMRAQFSYSQENQDLVRVDYYLTNGGSFSYFYQYNNGNKIEEYPYTGNTVSYGKFQYDDFINPYYLWGMPDEYLRYGSRNNEIKAEYAFSGGFPTFVPDTYNYTYDSEGYPVELIRSFKTYQTQQPGYTQKTVFNY